MFRDAANYRMTYQSMPSRTRSIDQQDSAGQTNLAGQLALPPPEDVANKGSKISDQLALPEPPQSIKTASVPNHELQLLDLLSGNFNSDMSPQTPATPPPIIASNEHHSVSSPVSQQQATGNAYASNIFQQQQPYSNGSISNMQPFSSQQGYQTSQYYTPYSAQQYQNIPWNRGYYVQNSYVAPWATGFKQPQSPRQNVVTQGSEGYSSASQVMPVSTSYPPLSTSYPPPPWTASSVEPVPQSINSQQRAMLYGSSAIPVSSSPSQLSPRTAPVLQQQRSFSSLSQRPTLSVEQQTNLTRNMQNMSLHENVTRLKSSTTNQPSFTPADRLFGDLIDMRSARASFKTSGISQNLSTPSSSKEETDNGLLFPCRNCCSRGVCIPGRKWSNRSSVDGSLFFLYEKLSPNWRGACQYLPCESKFGNCFWNVCISSFQTVWD